MLKISIEDIPSKVSSFSEAAITECGKLEADLQSGSVKAAEAYIPQGTVLVAGATTILTSAIVALQALKAVADTPGLKGRLLTLTTQLTDLETASKHEWGVLVSWVQTVFNHVKGKGA